jgi:hypothetical protein
MHATTILLPLFITLGVSLPMFPVARPYIPSGLGPLPSITTNAYITARGNVSDDGGKIAAGPVPGRWRHTHGNLSRENGAEMGYMGGECGEGISCAGEVQAVEELPAKRDMGDCEKGMWGC